ncbi:2,3-bisphosphoglycerate-independent phosphoglycerate mutase [Portibacter marinus]|uniref:2,3-bisphosphoglycerate-independent phosphoglycerate mutase n=1 Tax=Portibacter marinus TaxID=2898660 RepID=UPI001F3869CE|nr:2,3-bisphosphoglycerate-independent phosphoglycerate mutase [Portibacter marinus]
MATKKSMLIILDGWGHGKDPKVSAIAQAQTPFIDSLYNDYPNAELITFGMQVGLPDGQMGNSEVGHLNIGAGRVVYQDFTRINKAIQEGSFEQNEVLVQALKKASQKHQKVHLMGLVSDGGVHSHINHLKALIEATDKKGLRQVYIHAYLDGRDTDPKSGKKFLEDLIVFTEDKNAKLASIIGRYYAMDRDNRWERTKKAYDLLVHGISEITTDKPLEAIQQAYDNDVTDEFMQAIKVEDMQISDGDLVIFFNYRTDRPRQLTEVLTQRDHEEPEMFKLNLDFVTMTTYDASFEGLDVMYTKDNLKNTMGEVISNAGLSQVRIAETEKYPHVTFFFSGGREDEFRGERRILVKSPNVATYDLQPEMSAEEVKSKIVTDIHQNEPDFICLNFANTDMVGHTGDFEAAKEAATKVDDCVKQIAEAALPLGYEILIIADHGNSDIMINEDGSPNTAHTVNMVPIFYLSEAGRTKTIQDGKLADVAPTLLSLMGLERPQEMTGEILVT